MLRITPSALATARWRPRTPPTLSPCTGPSSTALVLAELTAKLSQEQQRGSGEAGALADALQVFGDRCARSDVHLARNLGALP